jgi:hypothetical protein
MTRTSSWTVLHFGRHKGKTLPQIALVDPDWFFWAVEEKVFKSPKLKREANEICRKATRILLPRAKGLKQRIEYAIDPHASKLADVSIVPASTPPHDGSSSVIVKNVLDLSMARQIASYDKLGGQIIARAIKYHVFGDGSARLTRERCERFFEKDTNFGDESL